MSPSTAHWPFSTSSNTLLLASRPTLYCSSPTKQIRSALNGSDCSRPALTPLSLLSPTTAQVKTPPPSPVPSPSICCAPLHLRPWRACLSSPSLRPSVAGPCRNKGPASSSLGSGVILCCY